MSVNEKMDDVWTLVTEKIQTGADMVSGKLGGVSEILRMRGEILEAEAEMEELYKEAGQKAVAARVPFVLPEVTRIDALRAKVAENKAKIEEFTAKKEQPEKEEKTKTTRAKYCSECGEKVKAGAKFCPSCGTKLV